MRGEERVREQRRCALVDRGGAHLHGGRRADLGADDDALDAGRAEARRPRTRARPRGRCASSPLPGRRPGDRPVDVVAARSARARSRAGGSSRERSRSGRPRAAARQSAEARRGEVLGDMTPRPPAERSRERRRQSRRPRRGRGAARSAPASASRAVRALRPATVATTRAPPRASASATALPIAPGLTMPTVCTRAESTKHAATSDARSACRPCLTNVRSVPWEPASSPAKEEARGAFRAHVAGRSRPARLR